MNKAYRVRLYPTQKQEVLINKTFGCVRLVWNTLLDKNIKGFENEVKPIFLKILNNSKNILKSLTKVKTGYLRVVGLFFSKT